MASIIKSDNGVSSGITGIVQSADSSGQLVLQTTTSGGTATTAVTIDNTQKVTFANSIGFGSNAGITFNNSSALTNSTINDYETGTWTPVINGTTMTAGSGWYTKIGRQVFLGFDNLTGVAAIANNASTNVTGLPFALSAYGQGGTVAISYNYSTDLSYKDSLLVGRTSNSNITFVNRSGVATATGDPFNLFASYYF